ncbi:MAG: hypothetical protein HY698_13735 [Deltaproteobacteria bacterium]|nr:hypothetical protein [Deltaproteobacteria bacterium]
MVTFLALIPILFSPPQGITEARPGRVVINWTTGEIVVVGAGPPDLRAPSAAVSRVGAERAARREATRRLVEAARSLKLAAGGTVGDKGVDQALVALATKARDVDILHASDGAVEVTLALSLESVRAAVMKGLPASAPPPVDAPTSIVVDARHLSPATLLGYSVVSGSARHVGPVYWHRELKAARADSRAGTRPITARALSVEGGELRVEAGEQAIESAARAGVAILIVRSPGRETKR